MNKLWIGLLLAVAMWEIVMVRFLIRRTRGLRKGYTMTLTTAIRAAFTARRIPTATTKWELAFISDAILNCSTLGVVVECGCFKGGSTAILSLACKRSGRQLHVFDSFCGLPEPSNGDSNHVALCESTIHHYAKGAFSGSLETVKANVSKHGDLSVCHFYQGYFDATLPAFREKIAVAFCDVDLIDSLKTCIRHLWPLLSNGGTFLTHEAHHLEVGKLFYDDVWWRDNLSQAAPGLIGAGSGLGLSLTRGGRGYHGSYLGMVRKNPSLKNVEQRFS